MDAEQYLGAQGTASDSNEIHRSNTIGDNGVGETHDLGAFGLGIAPRNSKPVHKIELSKEQEAKIAEAQKFEPYDMTEMASDPAEDEIEENRAKKKVKKRAALDKQAAFVEFKKEEDGKNLEESIRENRSELKTVKTKLKELTEKCNSTKKSIDKVKFELDKM